jgi:hypothetical protein
LRLALIVPLLLQGNFFLFMRSIHIVFVGILLLSVSCNNSGNTTKTQTSQPSKPPQSNLNETGTNILMGVVNDYYVLKNALVATKASDADHAATKLQATADSLQKFLSADSSNKTTLSPFVDTIITQSRAVTSVMDESCEKKRIAFETISSAMYGLVKAAGLKNTRIYHEYCPMAFNEKGAYWLSNESEIKNPYFGKKMLECGEVTDSL